MCLRATIIFDTFGIIIIIFVDYVMLSLFRPLEVRVGSSYRNCNGKKSGNESWGS
jgi:hypothetical protein